MMRGGVLATIVLLASGCGGVPAAARVRAHVSSESPVVVYGASWCQYTNATLEYLNREGIATQFRDVDRHPELRSQMDAALQRAGMGGRSIPVIDVHGRVLQGFDADQLRNALDAREPP